jgi:hypothetical protein
MDTQIAKDMAVVDAASWADVNKIKLQSGVWSFDGRPYLIEPLQSQLRGAPKLFCVMKATQLGFTESMVIRILWGLIHKYYERGALYLFPTRDDVGEFSKSRFGPLIQANPTAIGQFVKDIQSKTDSVFLKRVNGSNLFMRSGNLPKRIEIDAREAAGLRSISVDVVVYDEYDLMDPDVRGKASGRLDASKIGEQYFISNPTIPGFGIAQTYDESDQRHWFRLCKCGEWTCAELEFPNCVELGSDHKGYIACKGCGKPVGMERGEWVPERPENSDHMWGYQLSQLSSPTKDPYDILKLYNNPPEGNMGDVVRMKLGLPYISAEDKLTVQQVLSRCGDGLQLNSHPGPCAMGVDQRRHKNVVIGIRPGRDRYKILRLARVTDWDDVMAMANRFNVRSCVVDIRPYEDSARQFQKSAKFKTWLCEYSESTAVGTQYNDQTGLVKVNRTEILDATHRLVANEKMLELPKCTPEVKQFAVECAATAKVEEINKRTRTPVFRYRKVGTNPDDYRHALNYFYLAASGGKIAVSGGRRRTRPTHANNDYARC